MQNDATFNLADRMFRSIESGDFDQLAACYSPDIVVWTNVDEKELDQVESLHLVRWLCNNLDDLRYDVTRRVALPDGFIQEHVLRGTAPNGATIAMPACVIATVTNDKITRIHEYLDPSGVASLAS
ncbi:MAG: nuclear transport factor 2 family protein [Actinomycetes bacterium]